MDWCCSIYMKEVKKLFKRFIAVPTHMIQQVLNDDLVSRGGSFHQGSETGTWLPVGETKNMFSKMTGASHDFCVQPRLSLDVCVCVVIQQELDHLLVARACAVKQSRPSSAVLALQLSTLLQSGQKTRLGTEAAGSLKGCTLCST